MHIVNRFPVSGIYRDNSPVSVHYGMFLNALINLTSQEQQDAWLEPSINLQMIGTYAQTEIGHGTFVRGLETTATYDAVTQQFVMNTPSLSAYKWWPGGRKFLDFLLNTLSQKILSVRFILSAQWATTQTTPLSLHNCTPKASATVSTSFWCKYVTPRHGNRCPASWSVNAVQNLAPKPTTMVS